MQQIIKSPNQFIFIEWISCRLPKKVCFPAPGIEPGPAGWEPAILTTRPCRNFWKKLRKLESLFSVKLYFCIFIFYWVDLWGVSKIVVPQFLFKLLQSSQVQKSTGVTCDPLFIRTVAAVSCAAFSLWHHQKETGRDWTFSTARLTKKYFSSHFSCQPQQNLKYFLQL